MNANIRRWSLRLGADSKKLSLVVVLLAFGLLLWGRLLLQKVPRSASAMPPQVTQLSDEHTRLLAALDASTSARRIVRVDLPGDLGRDLFTFDPNPYKRTPDNNTSAAGPKSSPQQSDETTWIELAQQARSSLTLNSVVTQPRPYAVINGQLLMPGQSVEGYKLRSVSDRSVTLEKDGLTIRLKM